MIYETPFGIITTESEVDPNRMKAVQRALRWCETILESTLWTRCTEGSEISLQQTINQQLVELFPLEAAMMDLGMKSRFSPNHLPIHLNRSNACVRTLVHQPRALHTDLVASMLLLLSCSNFNASAIPRTMHSILTSEQRSSLPPPARRQPYVAGRPSTSGRDFLPELEIMELLSQHHNVIFDIQFEMRNGNLRDMRAREGMLMEEDEGETSPQISGAGMSYDPSDYHLKTVVDMERGQYRCIATDRVTKVTIGGNTYRTTSARD